MKKKYMKRIIEKIYSAKLDAEYHKKLMEYHNTKVRLMLQAKDELEELFSVKNDR